MPLMGTDVEPSNQPNSFEGANVSIVEEKPTVVFVLGGPGSGKGTQCANIVHQFGYTHLSAGDLLRAEIESGSENGTMIDNIINEGQIVPSEVTTNLLQRAMQESGNDKFLIDGFPRNEENRVAFENVTGIEPLFILFFDCPEEEMERRLLSRNEGRKDDNIETIRKRFRVFLESSLPVIAYYDAKGKVSKIDAARPVEEVFESVKTIFELNYKARLQKISEILQFIFDRKTVTEGSEIWETMQEALNISLCGIEECKSNILEEKEDPTH